MDEPPSKRRKTTSDSSGRVQRGVPKAPLVKQKPKITREEGGRAVRPRPLHVNEKVRVLWQGRDAEWDELDGGAFAQWLRVCEEEQQRQKAHESRNGFIGTKAPQVIVVGHSFKALPEDAQAAVAHAAIPVSGLDVGGDPIDVPKSRRLAKPAKSKGNLGEDCEDSVELRYVRYVNSEGDGIDGRLEYDMDEEDEEWLNQQGKQGGSRAQKSLTEDTFEGLMDHFEKGLHAAIQQRTELWQTVADPAAEPPDIQALYPLEYAGKGEELADIPEAAISAVYTYWCKKRLAAKRPLLQRLWFEQPWVRVRDASKEAWSDTHSQGETEKELPFMGKDSPKPNTRPRRISAEEALYKLESIRGELETIRTMADQVRRREKLRKRELLQWRKEWSGRLTMEGPSEQSVAEPALAAHAHEPAPDREARQASRAAAQAAREAANLLGAQVVVAPSGHEDHDRGRHRFSAGGAAAAAGAGPGIRSAHAGSPRKESLQPGPEHTRECFWCKRDSNLIACGSCPRCFCFNCYKQRPGYGIVNWGRILRAADFKCSVCHGKEDPSCEGDSVGVDRRRQKDSKVAVRKWPIGRKAPIASSRQAARADEGALPVPAAQPSRPAQKRQKVKARKQQPVVRDGLRHAKQNYEKLAGVKHSRSRAASRSKLAVPVKPSTRARAVSRARQVIQSRSAPTHPARKQKNRAAAGPGKGSGSEADEERKPASKKRKLAVKAKPVAARGARKASAKASSAGAPGGKIALGGASRQSSSKKLRADRQKGGQATGRAELKDVQTWKTGIPGITRVQRSAGQASRAARTEYVMVCRQHGAFRHDRVPRLVDFFRQHSTCQPEWAVLAQQPREKRAACEKRLRAMFSFSSVDGSGPCPITIITARSKPADQSSRGAETAAKRAERPAAHARAIRGDQPLAHGAAAIARPGCTQSARPSQGLDQGKDPAAEQTVPLKCVLNRRGLYEQGAKACSNNLSLKGKSGVAKTPATQKPAGCSRCKYRRRGCANCNPTHSVSKLSTRATGGSLQESIMSKSSAAAGRKRTRS